MLKGQELQTSRLNMDRDLRGRGLRASGGCQCPQQKVQVLVLPRRRG